MCIFVEKCKKVGQIGTKCCILVITVKTLWVLKRSINAIHISQPLYIQEPQTNLGKETLAKEVQLANSTKSTAQIDLFGEFRFKIDAKGRCALPSKFRKVLISCKDLIVSQDIEGKCLYAFTTESFNCWIDKLFEDRYGGFNLSNKKHVEIRRKLKARAEMVDIDSSGRITLKKDLRASVGIEKDVVLVGNTGHFEIWSAEDYDEMMDSIDLSDLFA